MQSGKAHINYQVNKKKVTNTKKMQEAIASTVKLLQRGASEGLSAWMKNALKLAAAKMKKYNVSMESLEEKAGVKIKDMPAGKEKKATYTVTKKGEGASKKIAKKATAEKKAPAPKKPAAEKKAPAKKAATPAKKAAPKKAPAKKAE